MTSTPQHFLTDEQIREQIKGVDMELDNPENTAATNFELMDERARLAGELATQTVDGKTVQIADEVKKVISDAEPPINSYPDDELSYAEDVNRDWPQCAKE